MSVDSLQASDPVGAVIRHSANVFGTLGRKVQGTVSSLVSGGAGVAALLSEHPAAHWGFGLASLALAYPAIHSLKPVKARQSLHRELRTSTQKLNGTQRDIVYLRQIRHILSCLDLTTRDGIAVSNNLWTALAGEKGWVECYTPEGKPPAGILAINGHKERASTDFYRAGIADYFGGFLHVESYQEVEKYLEQAPLPTDFEVYESIVENHSRNLCRGLVCEKLNGVICVRDGNTMLGHFEISEQGKRKYFCRPAEQVKFHDVVEIFDQHYALLASVGGFDPSDPYRVLGWSQSEKPQIITLAHLYTAMILESKNLLHTAPENVQQAWADFRGKNAQKNQPRAAG